MSVMSGPTRDVCEGIHIQCRRLLLTPSSGVIVSSGDARLEHQRDGQQRHRDAGSGGVDSGASIYAGSVTQSALSR
jgi:hypothetical protein